MGGRSRREIRMECPVCGLTNPPDALRCDCGHALAPEAAGPEAAVAAAERGAAPPGPTAPGDPYRRPISIVVTIILSGVLGLGLLALALITLLTPGVEFLETPNRTAVHVMERNLDLAVAARDLPFPLRWVIGMESPEEAREMATEAYDEVLALPWMIPGDVPDEVVEAQRGRLAEPRERKAGATARLMALGVVLLAAFLGGVAVIVVWLGRGGAWPALGTGHPVAPWGIGECYAVSVRALTFAAVLVVVAMMLEVPVLEQWVTLFASLGMIWLVRRRLLRPRGLTFGSGFGLTRPESPRTLALVSLAAFVVGAGGEAVLSYVTDAMGLESHWTEFILEDLLFGSPLLALVTSIDAIVWAPIFEEIGFRGLVYATLRSRMRVAPAVLLSATLFAAIHFYSGPGFVAVLWSGVVLALLYERTRSLWPCIILHALWNLLSVGGLVILFR